MESTSPCFAQALRTEYQYPIAQLLVSTASGSSFRFNGKNGPAVALAAAGISAIVFDKTIPAPQSADKDTQQLLARFLTLIDKSIPQAPVSSNKKTDSLSEKSACAEDFSCFRHCLECSSPCPVKKSVKERLPFLAAPSSGKKTPFDKTHDTFPIPSFSPPKHLVMPEAFLAHCNHFGLDRVEASSLLSAAIEKQMLPCDGTQASRLFMEHMEQKTPLGQEMGKGIQWFTRHHATTGKEQPAHKRTTRISDSYRQLLASLDCTGICMSAAKALATEEGMEVLLALLSAVAPRKEETGGPERVWTKELFLGLGKDTLARERSIIVEIPTT